jgi:[ribosomal protein S5]-alanine N-acetyltransferase
MFGNTIEIKNLILRQPKEGDIPGMVEGMNDWQVMKYLGRFGAMTEEMEKSWIEKTARDDNSLVWTIQIKGEDTAIGNTGIHGFRNLNNSGSTGCVIWDKKQWGKGVASLGHIARTWFAAKQLGLYTIHSEVFSPNTGSWKALERVGYTRTGVIPRCKFVDGHFVDKYTYTWINPEAVNILFPEGVPKKYKKGIKRAKKTLKKAQKYVKYVD